MIKVVVFVLVVLLGAWGHYAGTAIADDVIHSDSPEAQAIAKKFLAADIPEKITTQVAWDAAMSFSASPTETMAKLEGMSQRQLTALYYLVENWNEDLTSRFQRIWWKDMGVFVVRVQDLAGLKKYVGVLHGEFGELIPGSHGASSTDGAYLFYPEKDSITMRVYVSGVGTVYGPGVWSSEEIIGKVTVYCEALDETHCSAGKIVSAEIAEK